MEPTWVLSAPDGPHVGPMNLVIRVYLLQKYRACPLNAHLKYDYEDDLCCHNLPVHFGVLVLMFTPGWFSIILISKKWKKRKKSHIKVSSEFIVEKKWPYFCNSQNLHCQLNSILGHAYRQHIKLEQLERLRSEDTPRRLMITHTIESYWIPSQKKTKSKLQI